MTEPWDIVNVSGGAMVAAEVHQPRSCHHRHSPPPAARGEDFAMVDVFCPHPKRGRVRGRAITPLVWVKVAPMAGIHRASLYALFLVGLPWRHLGCILTVSQHILKAGSLTTVGGGITCRQLQWRWLKRTVVLMRGRDQRGCCGRLVADLSTQWQWNCSRERRQAMHCGSVIST
jgi:hypothetical protein